MTASIILGNHDKAESFRDLALTGSLFRPGGLYYERLIEGTRCLFLDSSSAVIGREQFRWIQEQARKAPGGRLVLFVHHPILDCGRTLMDRRYPLKNRDALRDFLDGLGLEVSVFCGHYHTNHEQRQRRITQYVTPSLFVQFRSQAESFQVESKETAYRLIEFDSSGVRTELVPIR
jgi:3',5'-cyclic AMP phosphodiesterase CpdA